jgi:hypothetical protein
MFDVGTPVWIKGTVVRFERINPHVMFTLEQKGDDGQVRLWTVEGPGLNSFTRAGLGADFLEAGDVIEVCGFGFKEEVARRPIADSGRTRPWLHGHVLVMSDERMRLFGGYGRLENCVRPDDRVEPWLEFLGADERGRNAWCSSRVFVGVPSVASQAFVDEVSRRMANPCPPLAER